jgi:hypothetical protein
MLCFSVALATWIGTVTKPNEMAPDQMVRGTEGAGWTPQARELGSRPTGNPV